MDKTVLIEYADMIEEIKDIRARIVKLEHEIDKIEIVTDSVKGTRRDGTIGSIRITGYPTPLFNRKQQQKKKLRDMIDVKEAELLELTIKAEEYIESMGKSELRTMFRIYFIDGESYARTALRLNGIFPKRNKPFTDESVKKRIQRFFKNVPQCPDERC